MTNKELVEETKRILAKQEHPKWLHVGTFGQPHGGGVQICVDFDNTPGFFLDNPIGNRMAKTDRVQRAVEKFFPHLTSDLRYIIDLDDCQEEWVYQDTQPKPETWEFYEKRTELRRLRLSGL